MKSTIVLFASVLTTFVASPALGWSLTPDLVIEEFYYPQPTAFGKVTIRVGFFESSFTNATVSGQLKEEQNIVHHKVENCVRPPSVSLNGWKCVVQVYDGSLTNTCLYCLGGNGVVLPPQETASVNPPDCEVYRPTGGGGGWIVFPAATAIP